MTPTQYIIVATGHAQAVEALQHYSDMGLNGFPDYLAKVIGLISNDIEAKEIGLETRLLSAFDSSHLKPLDKLIKTSRLLNNKDNVQDLAEKWGPTIYGTNPDLGNDIITMLEKLKKDLINVGSQTYEERQHSLFSIISELRDLAHDYHAIRVLYD
ncbi:MAG: hypothetical protein AABX74_05750 [Nanoarchaeota archaeon]